MRSISKNKPRRKLTLDPPKWHKPDFFLSIQRQIDDLSGTDPLKNLLLTLKVRAGAKLGPLAAQRRKIFPSHKAQAAVDAIGELKGVLLPEIKKLEKELTALRHLEARYEFCYLPFLKQDGKDVEWLDREITNPGNPLRGRRALDLYRFLREFQMSNSDCKEECLKHPDLWGSITWKGGRTFPKCPMLVEPNYYAGTLEERFKMNEQTLATYLKDMVKARWLRKTRYRTGNRGGFVYILGYWEPYYRKPKQEKEKGTLESNRRYLLTKDVWIGQRDTIWKRRGKPNL